MATRNILILICLTTPVAIIDGFQVREKREASPEDCMKPPVMRHEHDCCRLPKERIWGDIRNSFQMCAKKYKHRMMRQEMGDYGTMAPEGSDLATPTETPSQSASAPSTTPHITPGPHDHKGAPHWRKPHHHFRRSNDSCFIECVFEDQGFLMNKMVNKGALLDRLAVTLASNEPWHKVATQAVETCYTMEIGTPSKGTCHSKSEEVFRCIFKQLFFNCPNWNNDEYCESIKTFYQKCPEGPPPEINDNHSTEAPEEEMEDSQSTESESESETEKYTESA